MTQQAEHERWMRRALELAARGKGRVEPNPPVGAIAVRDGVAIGEGWHQHFGGPHAEVHAIEAAGDCRGATLYVTLAPCTGTKKKTPPCCDAVIKAGFKRIVIGAADPTQESAVPRLKEAGIQVLTGILSGPCERMIAPFLTLKLKGRPYVIAKWAMTADGRIGTVTGDSRWVSSEASRLLVHQWRNEVDAILVGAGTVRRDDPELTSRIENGRNPRRVILDSQASLPLTSKLVRSVDKAPVIVACLESAPAESCRKLESHGCRVLRLPEKNGQVDAAALLQALGADQLTNLLVEGGGHVLAHFLENSLVDEVRLFIAPKLIGGLTAPGPIAGAGVPLMAHAHAIKDVEWTTVGEDMLMTGRLT